MLILPYTLKFYEWPEFIFFLETQASFEELAGNIHKETLSLPQAALTNVYEAD